MRKKGSKRELERLIERVKVRKEIPPDERRRLREEACISTRELAAAIGVSHQTIVNWEKGRLSPNSEAEGRYYEALKRLREVND